MNSPDLPTRGLPSTTTRIRFILVMSAEVPAGRSAVGRDFSKFSQHQESRSRISTSHSSPNTELIN